MGLCLGSILADQNGAKICTVEAMTFICRSVNV
uniref:Uncharacterized protein n=1 Tax=Anguilla anguilla TaxID=7936 RepID=A0A0E9TXQ0_ANGAN